MYVICILYSIIKPSTNLMIKKLIFYGQNSVLHRLKHRPNLSCNLTAQSSILTLVCLADTHH